MAVSIGVLVLMVCAAMAEETVGSRPSDGHSPWKPSQDFRYAINPVRAPDDRPLVDSAEILTLEKVVVTRQAGARILENLFADQARLHAAEAFSWGKGGVIRESANKRVALKWKYKDDFHTIDLLSLHW